MMTHNSEVTCEPLYYRPFLLGSFETIHSFVRSGFGGAEVACWPLIPKFAGSNPAETVGFFKGG
jgi:hypothetical protein